MTTHLADLYRRMARARAFESAVADLWEQGLISGEMHLGTGEEAVAAGVVAHLRDGDGLALAHRGSPALVMRGVPLVPLLREMLGKEDGLCGGRGGHMHLFSPKHLAATSGIVGASLPTAAGFALAAKRLRKGAIGAAFTGDGAMNQGMALETLNLAVAWSLPLLVVCIDNGWAITTESRTVTGGDLPGRARAFGWRVESVDGGRVEIVHDVASRLIEGLRRGGAPALLHAPCPRLDGHYLGDPLLRLSKHPLSEGTKVIGRIVSGATSLSGGGVAARVGGLAKMIATMARARFGTEQGDRKDPLRIARAALPKDRREEIDEAVESEIRAAVEAAL